MPQPSKRRSGTSRITTVFIGDRGIGKNAILLRHKTGVFADFEEEAKNKTHGFIGNAAPKAKKKPISKTKESQVEVTKFSKSPAPARKKIAGRQDSLPTVTDLASSTTNDSSESEVDGNIASVSKSMEPVAFGFLDLLDAKEQEKFQELTSKAKSKKYELKIHLEGIEYPWLLRAHHNTDTVENLQLVTGIVFLFSLNNADSFEYIKEIIASYFYNIEDHHQAVLLVGTCCDLEHVVSEKQILAICRKYNICYVSCSAKDNINVQRVFMTLNRQILFKYCCFDPWNESKSTIKDKMTLSIINRDVSVLKQQYFMSPRSPSILYKNGLALIHIAVLEQSLDCAMFLLQLEPDSVNTIDKNGWTPLHFASRMGHKDMITLLVTYGADVFVKDLDGKLATDTKYFNIKMAIRDTQDHYTENRSLQVSDIPDIIEGMGKLTALDLRCANLTTIPEPILGCSQLTDLNLSLNAIKSLALDFGCLTGLKRLILTRNQITSIPNEIATLCRLEWLDLRNNKLAGITPDISKLSNLRGLLVSHNLLTHLPSKLSTMDNSLEVLDIYGNPLSSLPPDVIPKAGSIHPSEFPALMAYLRGITTGGTVEYNRVKVMFVGDGNVGKTSLLNCFLDKEKKTKLKPVKSSKSKGISFDGIDVKALKPKKVDPCDTIATDGIDINQVHIAIPGVVPKMMTWDCWDYAGQEVYYSTHQFFLSPRSVYLICFNLLDRDLSKVEYWINSVHSRARGSPMFLIGTHVDDKACTEEYIDDYISRLMSTIRPERFRSKSGQTSIKGIHALSSKKRTGVGELMDDITAIVQNCKFIGQSFPTSWLKLEQTLEHVKATISPFISWDDFEGIAEGCQIDKASIVEAVKFFHLSGLLCYFGDQQPSLRDFVILDPQFLANVMSALVTLKHRYAAKGILSKNDLPHIWREFPVEIHHTLMELLQKFEIAFCVDIGQKEYLIPCLFPQSRPPMKEWTLTPNQKFDGIVFARKYRFTFMPLGFFSRLIVRNLQLSKFESLAHWQNGQLLRYDGVLALLRYNPSSYNLHLQIHAVNGDTDIVVYNSAVKLLHLMTESIETTIEGWYDVTPAITVPCSHCLESGYSQWEFPISQCLDAVANKHSFLLCNNVRKIRLDILAPDLSFSDLQQYIADQNDIKFEEDIGEGTFGAVFRGTYKGEVVAVKELLTDEPTSPRGSREQLLQFQEFKREVWLLSCMKHPNVCSLKGICTAPLAIIMEYMPLGDLYRLIANPMVFEEQNENTPVDAPCNLHDFKVKLRLIYDIAKGMNHLHTYEPPIIHRDLRSPNIFVYTLDIKAPICARVGDFGLSRVSGSAQLAGGTFNRNWLAPEVIKGDTYNLSMDVYSFGIVMWEILCLDKPFEEFSVDFEGKPKTHFAEAVINGLRPTIPTCPPAFRDLIERCWHGIPSSRPKFPQILVGLKKLLRHFSVPFGDDMILEDIVVEQAPGKDILAAQSEMTIAEWLSALHLDRNATMVKIQQLGSFTWCAIGGSVLIYNSQRGLAKELIIGEEVCSLLKVNQNTMWVSTTSGKIFGYSNDEWKKTFVVIDHSEPVNSMLFIPDEHSKSHGAQALTADIGGTMILWKNIDKKPKIKHKAKLDRYIGCLAYFHSHIVVGSDHDILILNQDNLTVLGMWQGHSNLVNSLVVHGKKLWSCDHNGTILVWMFQLEDNSPVTQPLRAHHSRVFCLMAFQGYIFAGSFDKTISVWDPETYELVQELKRHTDGIISLAPISETCFWSGTLEGDATIGIWHVESSIPSMLLRLNGSNDIRLNEV